MARVCANCGTEVDEDALFCPTCGQPLTTGVQPELPPAPDWPAPDEANPPAEPGEGVEATVSDGGAAAGAAEPPEPVAQPAAPAEAPPPYAPMPTPWPPAGETRPWSTPEAEPVSRDEPEPVDEGEVTYHTGAGDRSVDASVPPWRRGATIRPTPPMVSRPPRSSAPGVRPGPIRPEPTLIAPETMSGWLESGGALLGAVAMLLPWRAGLPYTSAWGLASGINVVFAVVLVAVLAIVLLPHMIPTVPRRELWLAAIGLLGSGIGLDRFGSGFVAVGAVVFLIAMLALAVGALLAELGLDRRTGGPQP